MSTRREPLSRQRVAVAALAFIDEHGEASLSMRKLGAQLGVEAMSLYNHVANKDDLLDAVGDLLYAEVLAAYQPDPGSTWQQDARELSTVFRHVAQRHRQALPIMADRILPSSVKYVFLEKCYRVFTKAGFDTKEAALAFDTLASWVLGAIRQEMGLMEALSERGNPIPAQGLPPELEGVDEFADPELEGVHEFAEACRAWTPQQRFDFGFDTMIAGFESQLATSSLH